MQKEYLQTGEKFTGKVGKHRLGMGQGFIQEQKNETESIFPPGKVQLVK